MDICTKCQLPCDVITVDDGSYPDEAWGQIAFIHETHDESMCCGADAEHIDDSDWLAEEIYQHCKWHIERYKQWPDKIQSPMPEETCRYDITEYLELMTDEQIAQLTKRVFEEVA